MAEKETTQRPNLFSHEKEIKELKTALRELSDKFAAFSGTTGETVNVISKNIINLTNPQPIIIEYKPINSEASYTEPCPSREGSIGDDLFVPEDTWVRHGRNVIPLNIRINLPLGIEAKIEARSGFSVHGIEGTQIVSKVKRFLGIPVGQHTIEHINGRFNADVITGKVDPGYLDVIGVIVRNDGPAFRIEAGTRIAQITYYQTVAHRYKKVDEFTVFVPNRGGGFGHSGSK